MKRPQTSNEHDIEVTEVEIQGQKVPLYKIPPMMSGLESAIDYDHRTKNKPVAKKSEAFEEQMFLEDGYEQDKEDLIIKDALQDYYMSGETNEHVEDMIDSMNPMGIREDLLFDKY